MRKHAAAVLPWAGVALIFLSCSMEAPGTGARAQAAQATRAARDVASGTGMSVTDVTVSAPVLNSQGGSATISGDLELNAAASSVVVTLIVNGVESPQPLDTIGATGSSGWTTTARGTFVYPFSYVLNFGFGEYQVQLVFTVPGGPSTATSVFDIIIQPPGPTQEQLFRDLAAMIQNLVAGGQLNRGQGNSFIVKLNNAQALIAQGNTAGARQVVQAFLNEVNAFVSARNLTVIQAQPLIDDAKALIRSLGG